MHWAHPAMAAKWEAHTPKGAKLPEHVKKAADELKAKLAAVMQPTQGVVPGIPGPPQVQQAAAQPQPAGAPVPQLPGASDHPAAQQPGAGGPQAQAQPQGPQPIKAQPGQPINAADAASMAVRNQMKAAAVRLRLIGGALRANKVV